MDCGVTMRNLTIANDALSPETKGQEVALSVYGDAFIMEECQLRSTVASGTHFVSAK